MGKKSHSECFITVCKVKVTLLKVHLQCVMQAYSFHSVDSLWKQSQCRKILLQIR